MLIPLSFLAGMDIVLTIMDTRRECDFCIRSEQCTCYAAGSMNSHKEITRYNYCNRSTTIEWHTKITVLSYHIQSYSILVYAFSKSFNTTPIPDKTAQYNPESARPEIRDNQSQYKTIRSNTQRNTKCNAGFSCGLFASVGVKKNELIRDEIGWGGFNGIEHSQHSVKLIHKHFRIVQ